MSSIAKPTDSARTPDQDQPPLPPTALCLALLELYFTRIYNASLLFHKPVLFQQYLEQELHGALLRAMLALATLFLQPCDSDNENENIGDNAELKVLSIYHSSGLPWARAALKEAMVAAVDRPSLMIIQALVCLQHYWFGIGQPYQGNLCLALASHACHLLGYNKKFRNGVVDLDQDLSLESELTRRCFWACWTSTCIVMEPEPYVKSSWQEVAMVPLPGVIRSTPSGYRIILGEIMDENWNTSVLPHGTNPLSVQAILIKMAGVWAKVQLLCKGNKSGSILLERFESGLKLSQIATALFDDAKPYRNSDSHPHLESNYNRAQTPQDQQDLLIMHDALYHQCQISIHSMIVPLFSGIADEDTSEKTVEAADRRQSARTVAEHADLLRRLLEPYLSGQRHVSFLPPLVSYAAFVVGIVLLLMEISCPSRSSGINVNGLGVETCGNGNENGQSCRLSAVQSILNLLDIQRVYWRALQRPWEILHTALQGEFQKHSTRNLHQQANIGSNRPQAGNDKENPHMSAPGYCQVTEPPNDQPRPVASMVNDPAEDRPLSVVQPISRLATNVNDNGFEAAASEAEASEAEANAIDPLFSGVNVDGPQDYDWYNLSFVEAGFEQFAGLELSALFQHGWQTFG
ncbi:hypothetical protein G4B84_008955 [Aspergillus flavus NRRL3357]|nr:uncharacterized protein G4B84_008955 [Aspergillus flavus NRRL3357]QMW33489.1 hypothetical protein G4B84_008955 [Aspergillus flavus NRRL3357]